MGFGSAVLPPRIANALGACVIALELMTPLAHAAELDPRAEVTVQASPLECMLIWDRVNGDAKGAVSSEAQSDAVMRIGRAFDFEKVAKVVAAKNGKPTYGDFAGPRAPRKVPRDALDMLVTLSTTSPGWLVPTKERPVPLAQDAMMRTLRAEFREVLAGRNPYAK